MSVPVRISERCAHSICILAYRLDISNHQAVSRALTCLQVALEDGGGVGISSTAHYIDRDYELVVSADDASLLIELASVLGAGPCTTLELALDCLVAELPEVSLSGDWQGDFKRGVVDVAARLEQLKPRG